MTIPIPQVMCGTGGEWEAASFPANLTVLCVPTKMCRDIPKTADLPGSGLEVQPYVEPVLDGESVYYACKAQWPEIELSDWSRQPRHNQ